MRVMVPSGTVRNIEMPLKRSLACQMILTCIWYGKLGQRLTAMYHGLVVFMLNTHRCIRGEAYTIALQELLLQELLNCSNVCNQLLRK